VVPVTPDPRPGDFSQVAKSIVDEATRESDADENDQDEDEESEEKDD
jgi:hypothetical protein